MLVMKGEKPMRTTLVAVVIRLSSDMFLLLIWI
jgi:hypothetical protein